jgi:hypothetical protein
MTQIPMEIAPNLGGPDQVGLRMACANQPQAEALYRLLRQQFRVSPLLASFHKDYTHCVYVTASQDALSAAWAQIVTAVLAGSPQPALAQVSLTRPAVLTAAKQTTGRVGLEEYSAWHKRFRQVVVKLHEEQPPAPVAAEISPAWLDQEVQSGRGTEVEDLLLSQPGPGALRALVELYDRLGQHGKIVALYESRRDALLGLPVSGELARQLVGAYLAYGREIESQDALQTAQQIARALLPELERLQQADDVRTLISELARGPAMPTFEGGASPDVEIQAPVSEQIERLVAVEPAERIEPLRALFKRYPELTSVKMALAAAFAAAGSREQALALYRRVSDEPGLEGEEALQRSAEILLDEQRFAEMIRLLSNTAPEKGTKPALAGLRGVGLYWSGERDQARELLEWAWSEGDRSHHMMLALARLRAAVGALDSAAEPYRQLLDSAERMLTAEDYRSIAPIADGGGFGDLSEQQVAGYYDRLLQLMVAEKGGSAQLRETLARRLRLREIGGPPGAYVEACADWLEYLAATRSATDLNDALAALRDQALQLGIGREQHFRILEGIEPYADLVDGLRQILVAEYQGIALAEIDAALRTPRVEDPFFDDLVRALLLLNSTVAHDVYGYRRQRREEAHGIGVQVVAQPPAAAEVDLSSFRLAIVGGHSDTRRAVADTLRERHSLGRCTEVAPSSEDHVSRERVLERIAGSNLIAVITGYTGHDLTNIVRDLLHGGQISGQVLWLSCRGKSGVVRDILAAAMSRGVGA